MENKIPTLTLPEEEINSLMAGFKGSMRASHRRMGLPGLDTIYFNWQCLFAKAVIYKAEGLQFELRQRRVPQDK